MLIEVAAACLIRNKKVLIARRTAPSRLAGKWEFPGGKVEKYETHRACLIRELKEEFGITITVGDFVAAGTHRQPHGTFHIRAYQATWLTGDIIPTAHDRYAWAGPHDLLTYDLLPADIELAQSLLAKNTLKVVTKN